MKKISLLLCAIMFLSLFAGCGAKSVVGTWEAEIDMSESLVKGIKSSLSSSNSQLAEVYDLAEIYATARMTLGEDGSFSINIVDDSLSSMIDNYAKQYADRTFAYTEKLLKELGSNLEVGAVLGFESKEALEEDLRTKFNSDNFRSTIHAGFDKTGFYKVEEGKLFLSEKEESLDSVGYESFELDGNKLTLIEAVGITQVDESLYPIVYTRVK